MAKHRARCGRCGGTGRIVHMHVNPKTGKKETHTTTCTRCNGSGWSS